MLKTCSQTLLFKGGPYCDTSVDFLRLLLIATHKRGHAWRWYAQTTVETCLQTVPIASAGWKPLLDPHTLKSDTLEVACDLLCPALWATHCSIRVLEAAQFFFRRWPMFGRHHRLHRRLDNVVPQPSMIGLEQQNESGGL